MSIAADSPGLPRGRPASEEETAGQVSERGSAGVDSYSAFEHRFLAPAHHALGLLYAPPVALLAALHVPPNAVSLSQIALGLAVVALVPSAPRLALALFVLALVADGIDGALARATRRVTRFGALLDQYADHVREVTVVSGLALHGALSPFLAGLYALAYPGFNLTLYLCNRYGTPVPLAIKSYVTFYPALFAYLWSGVNYLDVAAALAIALMAAVVVQGLARLRRVMEASAE